MTSTDALYRLAYRQGQRAYGAGYAPHHAGRAVIEARQPHTLFEELPRHLRRFGAAV